MKHRTNLSTSERLQRVLSALQEAGSAGLTTWELMQLARVTDVKDAVYELRSQGVEVVSEMVRRGESTVACYVLASLLAMRRERQAVEAGLGVR